MLFGIGFMNMFSFFEDDLDKVLCLFVGRADLARQPGKPLTGIPTFLKIIMLDKQHPRMSYFPINTPPLKGPAL